MEQAPYRGDQQQHSPARSGGHSAVNRQNFGNPWDASQHKNQAMEKTAEKRDPGARTENTEQQQRQAEPGIEAGMRTTIGKREDRAAENRPE